MTNEEALKAWKKIYAEIDKDNWLFVGTINPEMVSLAIKALQNERPQGECESCRHRDTEDKKCDCGGQERQGCPFPVSDDYYCKYYEKGGAE